MRSGKSTAEAAKQAYTAPDAPRLHPPRLPCRRRPSSEACQRMPCVTKAVKYAIMAPAYPMGAPQ